MASNYFPNFEGIYENFWQPAVIIAGCFVVISLMLSLFLILQHLRSYTNPAVSCFPHGNLKSQAPFLNSFFSIFSHLACHEPWVSFMILGP